MSRIRKAVRTAKSVAAGAALGGFGGLLLARAEDARGSNRERLALLSKTHSTFMSFARATAKSYNRLKTTGEKSHPQAVHELIIDVRNIWTGDELWDVEDELDDSPPSDRDIVN